MGGSSPQAGPAESTCGESAANGLPTPWNSPLPGGDPPPNSFVCWRRPVEVARRLYLTHVQFLLAIHPLCVGSYGCMDVEVPSMSESSNSIDVYLEIGRKRIFAGAVEWPGWCRIGRDETAALRALFEAGPRYVRILRSARPSPASPTAFLLGGRVIRTPFPKRAGIGPCRQG